MPKLQPRTVSITGRFSLYLGAFCLCAWTTLNAATVTRGPYLQIGTPNSVVVRWRTDVATDSRVRYGAAPGNLTAFAGSAVVGTEHEVTLDFLTPSSQYYYSVGTSAQPLAGDDADHFFVTSPPVGTAEPTRVWVLGDPGTANASQFAVRDAYYSFTGNRHTDLWLMLGDNAYQNGTDAEYQTAVFNVYPAMLKKSVLWSALGNHDTAQATAYVDTYPYFSIFTLPRNGEAGGIASGTEHFYSFDFGNIHFVCLDSMTADRSPGGPMATWLQSDLAATVRDWIIAFWHHPAYTKGSHNSDTEVELVQMRQNFLPILEAGGVDLVMAGHSHDYERSYLIDSHYGLSGTLTKNNFKDGGVGRDQNAYQKPGGLGGHNGAVYAVAGSSGQTSGGSLNHPAMVVSLNVLGSMVLDFQGNRLDVTFVNSTAGVQDYFTILKGVNAVASTPTHLTGTAGDGQVALGWYPSSGATTYNVKRATFSGGPYATIVNVATTTHVDTSVVNGTTYYYVVAAVNGAGESGNSTQVSATPQGATPPQAPTSLTASASGKKKINLRWTQSSSPNVVSNKVYRATASGGPYSLVATIAATTSYNNTGLNSGTTYYYVITAVNSGGLESTASNQASATAR